MVSTEIVRNIRLSLLFSCCMGCGIVAADATVRLISPATSEATPEVVQPTDKPEVTDQPVAMQR